MPGTRNFSELRDEARRDPERARWIDEGKQRAIDEIADYCLGELRKDLGVTQAELDGQAVEGEGEAAKSLNDVVAVDG